MSKIRAVSAAIVCAASVVCVGMLDGPVISIADNVGSEMWCETFFTGEGRGVCLTSDERWEQTGGWDGVTPAYSVDPKTQTAAVFDPITGEWHNSKG